MARLRGCLPLLSFVVFFISSVEGTHLQRCHRVFPLQLTAAAMPCQYICAYYYGYGAQYLVRGEDDGTFCQKNRKTGVCWNGECLTRYGEEDQWSQQAGATSKVPLRIRKRDVTSVTKGATVTKTVESNGDSSISTKGVQVTKTVKSSAGSQGTKSAAEAGLQGNYITGFGQQTTAGTKNGMSGAPSVDVDPFAIKNTRSGSQTTESFFSRGIASPHISRTVNNGGINVVVHRGPNGRTVTTRTVKKVIITKGPTKTVRRIIIQHGSKGGARNLILGGSNTRATKTVKIQFNRGPMVGTNGPITGVQTGISRKTSQITTVHTTSGAQRNPIASIVQTIKQQRISGGQNVGEASSATKTASTVAVTKSVRPSVSVQVTKQVVTPLPAATSGTSNTGTLRGVEVEVPGYTAGLRHNWKWVLARRVGVYPPYVQALDPDVLFYKLGLRKPNLPSLPGPVLHILNQVPVHPVGSDIYGFLLSSKIMEKIRGFTDGVNGLTKLRSMLSTSNTSNLDSPNLLQSILTGSESSPLRSTLLAKILLASLSGQGGNPLTSAYGGLFGHRPWPTFPGGQFLPGSWPFSSRGTSGHFGSNPSIFPGSPFSPFDFYNPLDNAKSSTGLTYTMSEEGGTVPSTTTPSSDSAESLLGDYNYVNSIISPTSTGSYKTERRYGQSYDESLEHESEKLAQSLGEKKLRHLLNIPSQRDSPLRRLLKRLYRREHNIHSLLRRLGVRPHTPLYNRILRQIVLGTKHGALRPSEYRTPHGVGRDKTLELISKLRELSGNSNYDTIRYLSTLTRRKPLESTRDGSEGSHGKLTTLVELLLERKDRLQAARQPDSVDQSDTKEVIDALVDYPRRHPSTNRNEELRKQITKALLTSHQGPLAPEESRAAHMSRLLSVQGTSHTEKRPQGLRESQVVSTTYHSSKLAPTAIPISPATASILGATSQIAQMAQPVPVLGMNSLSTTSSSQSSLQPYQQFVSPPFYLTGGNGVSNQAALSNQQFVSSTGSLYGAPLSQPTATMMTGSGGYTGYATLPASTAYVSQYGTQQPYYVGTSLYGNHPHYIVEGHEAPGTRWQLRVWRHLPGVSYVAPGYNAFESSHLGSVVTRARETVTNGLHLGSQPGQFGFRAYGATVPGGNTVRTSSQYVVRSPDGHIALSREPLAVGSPTQAAPTSSVTVSQTTKQMTKTTSGTLNGGLSSDSLQSVVEGGASGGITKSDLLSEIGQSKETSLFKSAASGSGSENTESSFSSGGSGSSNLPSDGDLSQSKLR